MCLHFGNNNSLSTPGTTINKSNSDTLQSKMDGYLKLSGYTRIYVKIYNMIDNSQQRFSLGHLKYWQKVVSIVLGHLPDGKES